MVGLGHTDKYFTVTVTWHDTMNMHQQAMIMIQTQNFRLAVRQILSGTPISPPVHSSGDAISFLP